MAATYFTLLTKIGQAKIANAIALDQMVNLTSMAVGDGNGNPTTPNENQTQLVRERYRAQINQLTVDADNPNYIVAEMIVPTDVGGWAVNEVGVFDDEGNLVAVANFPATYKPQLAEGSGRDLVVRIVIQVSNTSVVTLKVDPAIILASQAWVAANFVKKVTVAGGTTNQVLAKASNADEHFKWIDPSAAVDVIVHSREETQTLASGQTVVDLAVLTTDGAAVYIEGVRLTNSMWTVNSPTRLTLASTWPAGSKITVVQNEEVDRNAFMLKTNNLSELTDKVAARANLGVTGRLLRTLVYTINGGQQQVSIDGGAFATTGATTYTPHAEMGSAIIEVQGGGGGGGGTQTTGAGQYALGSGGASGSYALSRLTKAAIGASQTVTVGTPGAFGPTNGNGGNGGTSSFGSLISAPGGAGGTVGIATTPPFFQVPGFPGAVATGGNILNTPGSPGETGHAIGTLSLSGGGGGSPIAGGGGGGRAVAHNSIGQPATAPGAGGSGGALNATQAATTGGIGGAGMVIIREFA